MFAEREIIYFDPFYFKNGNPAKCKYFLVLKVHGGKSILSSLPTRKDHIPKGQKIPDGCIELPEANQNCFVISPETEATECGKCFDFTTHLYGQELDVYSVDFMTSIYHLEGVDYIRWGMMPQALFDNVVDCFRNSSSVSNKHIKMLSA